MTPMFHLVGSERQLRRIRTTQISRNPYQPRKYFEPEAIRELADSIRQYGVLNPLTVRRTTDGYELIAGERRLRAARAAGLSEVPCLVMSATEEDSSAIALVENLQRRDLDFFEEAAGYRQLIDRYGLTQEEAAHKVGKTQSAVANKLRLLKLSPETMQMIRDGGLTERHARAILRLPTEEARCEAISKIVAQQWNVSRTEQYIEHILSTPQEKPAGTMRRLIKDVRLFLNTVDKAVGLMKESGVETSYEKEQREDGILVKILIPNARH
ncbi:MAG: ParB/RepB/Spo0J family partition protein [Butyricicoccus pullicaecorum]|nr:ParB/RepB/Spo0J family partition protein [Butyricicoccus pullicaecorum]MBS5151126.1 ParB/RepB/Spo0J family partition protein [Butyricicoccus pullicaecorum]MDO4668293.1 ParB/RepB/Spo0J family partition protein [Butyricicoccus pullicaecorum]